MMTNQISGTGMRQILTCIGGATALLGAMLVGVYFLHKENLGVDYDLGGIIVPPEEPNRAAGDFSLSPDFGEAALGLNFFPDKGNSQELTTPLTLHADFKL